METELKNLLDKIKKEGVEKAESDKEKIIKDAQDKANRVIESANKEKEKIIKEAKVQSDNFSKASEKALKQAARDVLLTLRERANDFFGRVVKEKVSEKLSLDILTKCILKAVENLKKDGIMDIEVLVEKDDRVKLEKALFNALDKEAKKKVITTGKKGMGKGFRIGEKGKESYLDFTDEALAEGFKRYLSPKLVEILDIDLGIGKE